MPRREDDPDLLAEGELAMARLALDGGDLDHAANHLAGAVVQAPTHPEVLAAFTALVGEHGRAATDLFSLDGNVYLGTVVARGYVLALLGQLGEAVDLLCRASEYDLTGGWAHAPWLADPAAGRAVEPGWLLEAISHLIRAVPGPADEATREALRPYLELTGRVLEHNPGEGRLYGFASGLARRIGGLDLALLWAQRAVELEPSGMNELFLGMVHRDSGRIDEAAQAMGRAIEVDQLNLAIYSDLADMLAGNGRLAEALDWIARAEQLDPEYDCVVHVGQRLRFERDGDVAHLVRLADFSRAHPDTGCRHSDLARACEERMWLGFLPDASEACTSVLAQMLANDGKGPARLGLTDFEPPSAIAVVLRALPGSTVAFDKVSTPDPRKPIRRVKTEVWKFRGTQGIPAVPAPAEAASRAMRALATVWLSDPVATYDHAVRLSGTPINDLLGLLVHPPAPPESGPTARLGGYPAIWTRAVQAWACLGLLHHRTDEPWPSSTRRDILVDLAFGPEDWVTEAALFALMTGAWVHPELRTDVAAIVGERLVSLAEAWEHRPVTIIGKVAQLALVTPELDSSVRTLAARIVRQEFNLDG